jgi:hypothetical protein
MGSGRAGILAATLTLLMAVLWGCGSGGSTVSTQTNPAAPEAAAVRSQAARQARREKAKAPSGASSTLRAIHRQFRPPRPDPLVKGSAAAIAAGRRACSGKTPVQVKQEFFSAARPHLAPQQVQMIARIQTYERHETTDPSFIAGQLGADVYAATLPTGLGQSAYQGCVYALSLGLG